MRRSKVLFFCAIWAAFLAMLGDAMDNEEHARKIKTNFKDSDTNKDGFLDLAELTEARKSFSQSDPQEHAKGTIRKMDQDSDQKVSLKEFLSYYHLPHDEL
mmetsp:Transcript_95487/g.165876  ORF Transcript_95487/g.165876 Transcript_95487/m.165876 type:complete len:101 (-) Transcript_95487:239-541(-)